MSFQPSNTQQGVAIGVNPRDYHAMGEQFQRGDKRRTMSHSELRKFAACPQKWIEGVPEESSDERDWGSLVDCIVTTPDLVETIYAVTPETYLSKGKKKADPLEEKEWTWQSKTCRAWRDDKRAQGLEVVTPEMMSNAWKAAKKLTQDPRINALLESSDRQVQVCVDWHDKETGLVIPFKCLLDLLPRDSREIADLKTTNSLATHKWSRHVFTYGLHSQGATYLDAYNVAAQANRDTFKHVVQESFPPYSVGRRALPEEFLTLGEAFYRNALAKYCQCLQSGFWPGYDDESDLPGEVIDGWRYIGPEPWMIMQ